MADITTTKTEDLLKELGEKREALRGFRFSVAGTRVRNVREGRGLRREIARVLTELTRRKQEIKTKTDEVVHEVAQS